LAGLAGKGGALRLVDRFIRSLTWQSPYKPLDLTSEMQTFIGCHTSARWVWPCPSWTCGPLRRWLGRDRHCAAPNVLWLADGDTGYGNALAVQKTIRANATPRNRAVAGRIPPRARCVPERQAWRPSRFKRPFPGQNLYEFY